MKERERRFEQSRKKLKEKQKQRRAEIEKSRAKTAKFQTNLRKKLMEK
ncbi:hypothetical protein HUG20_11160 [Salicibibacter cibi]|uniref:Uncharacterized protein n=1 Tax=Salicibibacter cibi TaxID=2743001 RepID=A0A7T6ZBS8_9BACI|nr:hypothetical protein [Salicibibacter cibi]QQK80395.1 hypothetical protein HUG20_11160 [Salicibibacter cibi]